MSRLSRYCNDDPQNDPLEWDDTDEDNEDPDAELETRESAKQRHLDWKAEHCD